MRKKLREKREHQTAQLAIIREIVEARDAAEEIDTAHPAIMNDPKPDFVPTPPR